MRTCVFFPFLLRYFGVGEEKGEGVGKAEKWKTVTGGEKSE